MSSLSKKVVDALERLRIRVGPYIIFLEELSNDIISPRIDNADNKYEIKLLGPGDMKAIEAFPERISTEAGLLNRLKEDKVCIAVKLDREIVGFTWYDLNECNFKGITCPLKDNEAYLYDAYTLPPFRGKSIAPFMRFRSYQELNHLGKNRLISVSDYFNTPAVRFKKKLKARPLELRTKLFFRGIHLDVRLKRYTRSLSKFRTFYLRILVRGHKIIENY